MCVCVNLAVTLCLFIYSFWCLGLAVTCYSSMLWSYSLSCVYACKGSIVNLKCDILPAINGVFKSMINQTPTKAVFTDADIVTGILIEMRKSNYLTYFENRNYSS